MTLYLTDHIIIKGHADIHNVSHSKIISKYQTLVFHHHRAMEGRAEALQLDIKRLHDAAIEGDVPSLLNLFHIDPFILDRCMSERLGYFMQSPLHTAASLGHLEFTKEILRRKPELAGEVDDHLHRWSPLHMASEKGHLEIVKALLEVNPDMCFTRDQDGRNPVHIAAINGQTHVLDVLFQAQPRAAMERTNDGETMLHLCVKHNQLEALMFLAKLADVGELLNFKDGHGNTALQLAVAAKQPQMVEFLETRLRIERNAMNNRRYESGCSQTSQSMEAATMTRLYEAILKGDEAKFHSLLKEDPLILDRCMIENSSGRFMQSPLHIAVEKGNINMVTSLLAMNRSMCLSHDRYGRTPIHVAAVNGHIEVLRMLHDAYRYAAQEKSSNGESILHLCVKHGQLIALKILIRLNEDDGDQLINSKDNNGNTILHLAVTSNQPEMVEYLLAQCKSSIEINAVNNKDMTAVDLYKKQSKKALGDKTIEKYLKRAKAKQAKDTVDQSKQLEKERTALMVVATLIATMAFQVGVNPPGGSSQDDKSGAPGTAILSYYDNSDYQIVLISNTIGYVSSASVIMLLISGFPLKRSHFFVTILRVILWIAMTAISLTYLMAVLILDVTGSRKDQIALLFGTEWLLFLVWISLIFLICFGNVLSFVINNVIGWQKKELIRRHWRHLKNWFAPKNTNEANSHV